MAAVDPREANSQARSFGILSDSARPTFACVVNLVCCKANRLKLIILFDQQLEFNHGRIRFEAGNAKS